MSTKVILIGGFTEIIELCEDNDYLIVGVIDKTNDDRIMGYRVLGNDEDAPKIYDDFWNVPVIVSPDLPAIRKKLVVQYKKIGFYFHSLISRKAMISRHATIGEGVIIHNGANISAKAEIGAFVRVNVYANVMHDCSINAFSTIAPNSVLLGHVKVGEGVYVGANSTILPHVSIDDFAIIGAGAVVTRNVSAKATVKGVPAK
jgi:sugar O-acyltransferase (sialic acid O-acetyltransferase NeuD family)